MQIPTSFSMLEHAPHFNYREATSSLYLLVQIESYLMVHVRDRGWQLERPPRQHICKRQSLNSLAAPCQDQNVVQYSVNTGPATLLDNVLEVLQGLLTA